MMSEAEKNLLLLLANRAIEKEENSLGIYELKTALQGLTDECIWIEEKMRAAFPPGHRKTVGDAEGV